MDKRQIREIECFAIAAPTKTYMFDEKLRLNIFIFLMKKMMIIIIIIIIIIIKIIVILRITNTGA